MIKGKYYYKIKKNNQRKKNITTLSLLYNKCNFNCPYCYLKYRKKKEILAYNKIIDIIKQARDIGVISLELSGGEPLLLPYIYKILDEIRKMNFELALITNGSLLNEQIVAKLLSTINMLTISLDTVNANCFKIMTGGKQNYIEKILNYINYFNESSIELNINLVVTNMNINYIKETIDMLLLIGIHPKNINVAYKLLPIYKKPNEIKKYLINDKQQKQLLIFLIKKGIIKKHELIKQDDCSLCLDIITMGFDGEVYPCSTFGKSLGNIRKFSYSLKNFWKKNNELQKLRTYKENSNYTGCSCYAANYNYNKDIKKNVDYLINYDKKEQKIFKELK